MKLFSDEELILQCKDGNPKAQLQLYRKYAQYLYTSSYRIVKDKMQAEDIVQEAFIQFFDKMSAVNTPNSIKFWLRKNVVNKSIDQWKKNNKIHFLEVESIPETVPDEDVNQWTVEYENVLKKVDELPEKYRIMIEMFYLQNYSHQEIAESLQISHSNSRVLLKRAKEKLKKLVILKPNYVG